MHYWSKSGRHGRQIAVLALSVLLGAIAWPSGVGADAAPRDSTASARAPSGRVLAPAYSITDLGTLPGGGASFATDINAVGQIVGSGTHNGQTRAFLLTPLPGAGP